MKNHKNILVSLISYVVAIAWLLGAISIGNSLVGTSASASTSNSMNAFVLIVFFILLIISAVFGLKGSKAKESSWAGNLLATIAIITGLMYLLLMSGFMGY